MVSAAKTREYDKVEFDCGFCGTKFEEACCKGSVVRCPDCKNYLPHKAGKVIGTIKANKRF